MLLIYFTVFNLNVHVTISRDSTKTVEIDTSDQMVSEKTKLAKFYKINQSNRQ